MPERPVAIIDIGSNSVRLVVYSAASRSPSIIFNEKVMAGLGKGVSATGALAEGAQERALTALARFSILVRRMGVKRPRVVATAAVREASNGPAFLARIRDTGLKAELVSGEEEAAYAGWGVISAIPEADGVVADLGGGSLELVEVRGGEVLDCVSLPLGVLRVAPLLKEGGEEALLEHARALIAVTGFAGRAEGRPLYLVGGSWRSLARLDMLKRDYPLPITHFYRMQPSRPKALQKAANEAARNRDDPPDGLSPSRAATLPQGTLLLRAATELLGPSELVVSSFGIREGLLFKELDAATRRLDPLIEAAREAGRGLSRFGGHGDVLDRWIGGIFGDEGGNNRLRLAACLLSDVAWQAHPDFRAERGVEMALHGNWVGIDARGRVMIAQALFCNFGGGGRFEEQPVARLCTRQELDIASRWGLAMRVGQRLSGGVGESLKGSRLSLREGVLRLELKEKDRPLFGESVDRRLRTLAASLGCDHEVGTF